MATSARSRQKSEGRSRRARTRGVFGFSATPPRSRGRSDQGGVTATSSRKRTGTGRRSTPSITTSSRSGRARTSRTRGALEPARIRSAKSASTPGGVRQDVHSAPAAPRSARTTCAAGVVEEGPDRREAAGARVHHLPRVPGADTAHGVHGYAQAPRGLPQGAQAQGARLLPRRGEDGAQQHEVGALGLRAPRALDRMARSAHHEPGKGALHLRDGQPFLGELHAQRAGGGRHVGPAVHQDRAWPSPRSRPGPLPPARAGPGRPGPSRAPARGPRRPPPPPAPGRPGRRPPGSADR